MIIPVGERVLVEQDKKEIASTLAIVSTDDFEESTKKPSGKIVLIGSMVSTDWRLAIGNVVFFNEYSGERVKEGDKEWLLLKPQEILAKINNE